MLGSCRTGRYSGVSIQHSTRVGLDLIERFPELTFIPGNYFMWSPYHKVIIYDSNRIDENNGRLALLHEIGHARLGHRIYRYDIQLITMEMDAWDVARELAPQHGVKIDEEQIAQTIEGYDEWLTKRSTCPDCNNFSLQRGRDSYGCFACGAKWTVNWRKDRRVKRTVTSRFEPIQPG